MNDVLTKQEAESLNLTPNQQTVLLAFTTEWLSPMQLSERLPQEGGNLYSVNQSLKELVRLGLVQINPVIFGMYRITADGITLKNAST
jgi:Fe2+ or Zn2+ uptake regulation protein